MEGSTNLFQCSVSEGRRQLALDTKHPGITEDRVNVHEDILYHDVYLSSSILKQLLIVYPSQARREEL